MANKKLTLIIREADKEIFEAIRKGKKKVETRAATPEHLEIESGDTLVFSCGNKRAVKQVDNSAVFKSIKDLLKKYKVKDINPDLKTEKELKDMYMSFPGYAEKIKKYGLVAWELE